MADQTPLQAININLKATLQDLAVVKMVPQTGEMSIYPARNYIYATCEPEKEFFTNLVQFENIQPSGNDGAQYGIAAVIDLRKYYSSNCSLQVTSAGSSFNTSRVSVQVDTSGKKMLYLFNSFTPDWQNSAESDTFGYTITDSITGEIDTAQVSISRFALFVPNDLYIELNPFYSGIIRIDLRKFINNGFTVAATLIGVYNGSLISNITIDPQNPQYIQVTLVTTCADWDCDWTDFEVFLQLTDPVTQEQQQSKIYANLIKACDTFLANPIEIDIDGDVPAFIEIDIARFNEHAFIELLQIGNTDAERGQVIVNSPLSFVRYNFNRNSNYWGRNQAHDMFEYNIRNRANGKTAKSYILIRKTGSGSSSSGSGPDFDFNTTYSVLYDTTLIKQASQVKSPPATAVDAASAPGAGLPKLQADSQSPAQRSDLNSSVPYNGTIVTKDNSGNQVSLPAKLLVSSADGSFTGNVGDSQIKGNLTYTNDNITNDPVGTPLTITGGTFNLTQSAINQ